MNNSSFSCTCIIPFFNEGERIFEVLRIVTKERAIQQIICVDDGSIDNSAEKIQKNFPQVELIQLTKNQGKTAAIQAGLKKAKSQNIFLLDADLHNLQPGSLDSTIQCFLSNPSISMIIWRRTFSPLISKLDRADILFSGERILKKKDLEDSLKLQPKGFEVEAAINQHIQQQGKKSGWVHSSAKNTYKIEKYGLLQGFWRELLMVYGIIYFLGIRNTLRQFLYFCHEELCIDTQSNK